MVLLKEIISIIVDCLKNIDDVENDVNCLKEIYGENLIAEDINDFRTVRTKTIFIKWFLLKLATIILILPVVKSLNVPLFIEDSLVDYAISIFADIIC